MKIQQRKLNQGFTIIEVLIVLAIAGLILAIVFLAVPALQRNTRNNGRINDVARVGASVNNWVSNNNGATFNAAGVTAVITDVGNLSQYPNPLVANTNLSQVDGSKKAVPALDPTVATNLSLIQVVTGAQCGAAGATAVAGAKQMAIQYQTEGGGGPVAQCLNI